MITRQQISTAAHVDILDVYEKQLYMFGRLIYLEEYFSGEDARIIRENLNTILEIFRLATNKTVLHCEDIVYRMNYAKDSSEIIMSDLSIATAYSKVITLTCTNIVKRCEIYLEKSQPFKEIYEIVDSVYDTSLQKWAENNYIRDIIKIFNLNIRSVDKIPLIKLMDLIGRIMLFLHACIFSVKWRI